MTSIPAGTKGVYRRCCNGPATAASHVLLDAGDSSHKTHSPGQLSPASLAVLGATYFKTSLGTCQMPTWETQSAAHNLRTTSARHASSLTRLCWTPASLSQTQCFCRSILTLLSFSIRHLPPRFLQAPWWQRVPRNEQNQPRDCHALESKDPGCCQLHCPWV